jgi:hypothetical protein
VVADACDRHHRERTLGRNCPVAGVGAVAGEQVATKEGGKPPFVVERIELRGTNPFTEYQDLPDPGALTDRLCA